MSIEIEPPINARYLRIFSVTLLCVLVVVLLIAFDYARVRSKAEPGAKPNFLEYIEGYARAERAAEYQEAEIVGAIGNVPGNEDDPETGVVAAEAASGPSSWFRRAAKDESYRVEFNCVTGVGGSKICTSEKIKR